MNAARTLLLRGRPFTRLSALLLLLGLLMQLGRVALAEDAPDAPRPVSAAAAPEAPVRDLADIPESARPDRQPALPDLHPDGAAGRVVIVPIDGTIDLGIAPFVRRVIEENGDADAIILDVNTFGGRVDAAVQIRDAVLASKAPTIAWVHPRAISAGALISYAADTLVFASGGSMGAATPINVEGGQAEAVDEKFTSYMRTEMRTTAEARGRNGLVAEAMVDRNLVVTDVVPEGRLLTASTALAVQIGLADGTADDLDSLLAQLGLATATVERAEASWAEDLARILTDPTLSGLLMSLGFLGIMVELYTPGVGLPGALGLLCLVTFFAGHMVANLAGWEEVLLLVVGVAMIAVEIFVIPGFGVVGVAGLVCVAAALALSLTGMPVEASWDLGFLGDALRRVLLSMAATIVGLVVLARFLPVRVLPDWLVLRTELGKGEAAAEAGEPDFHSTPDLSALLGRSGLSTTVLRPSGKARIDGQLVDVVSSGDWIAAGTAVSVVEVEGVRVVVEALAREPANKAQEASG